MKDAQQIVKELGELLERPDPRVRERVLRTISKESIPGRIRLLGNQVMVIGVGIDRWILDGKCAGVAIVNKDEQPTVWQLTLGCQAGPADLPITAIVDDGERRQEVRFERPGFKRVDIPAVGPRSERLFIVATDKTWTPGGHDQRRLGVNVDVTPTGTLEALLQDQDPPVRNKLTTEIARESFAAKGRLLGNQVVAAGLSLDHWTEDGAPAAVVFTNYDDREVTPELIFSCHAGGETLPVTLTVEDGLRKREYVFDRPGDLSITLSAVAPHSKKLYIITTDKTWSPGGGDQRQLGVSVNISPSWTLKNLKRKPDAYIRVKLAEAIANERFPGKVELLSNIVVAVGLSGDRWTLDDEPTAVVVTNTFDEELLPELILGCNAGEDDLPVTATIDDGTDRESYVFTSPGTRTVTLNRVPHHSRRLYIISTDRTWSPGGGDRRRLGVSVDISPMAVLENMASKYDPQTWTRVSRAIVQDAGQPGRKAIPGAEAAAVGITPDGWTTGSPAAVAILNDGAREVVHEIVLACHAGPEELPLAVTLLDGDFAKEVTFERAGSQAVVLTPLPAGESRLLILRTDRTWSPGGGDHRDLGVLVERLQVSLEGTMESLLRRPQPEVRQELLEHLICAEIAGKIDLLDERVWTVGLTGDQWTHDCQPAALVVTNGEDEPLVLDVNLECHARPESLPLVAVVDDGRQKHEVRIVEPGTRTLTLDRIPPGEQLLVIVTTDRTWSPGTEQDQRELGVRITVAP